MLASYIKLTLCTKNLTFILDVLRAVPLWAVLGKYKGSIRVYGQVSVGLRFPKEGSLKDSYCPSLLLCAAGSKKKSL